MNHKKELLRGLWASLTPDEEAASHRMLCSRFCGHVKIKQRVPVNCSGLPPHESAHSRADCKQLSLACCFYFLVPAQLQ